MDEFIEIASASEVPDGGMISVEIEDHELMIARQGSEYFVADGRCPHMGGHLARGVLEGTVVTCPRHHSQFDLTDGHVVRWTDWQGATKTMSELIRHPRPLRTYEVRVQGGKVLIGQERAPDPQPQA